MTYVIAGCALLLVLAWTRWMSAWFRTQIEARKRSIESYKRIAR